MTNAAENEQGAEVRNARAALQAHTRRLERGLLRGAVAFCVMIVVGSVAPAARFAWEFGLGDAMELGAGDGLCSSLCSAIVLLLVAVAVRRPGLRFVFRHLTEGAQLLDVEIVAIEARASEMMRGWPGAALTLAQVLAWLCGLPHVLVRYHFMVDEKRETEMDFAYPDQTLELGPGQALFVSGRRPWLIKTSGLDS